MGKLFQNYTILFLAICGLAYGVFGFGPVGTAHADEIGRNNISASTGLSPLIDFTIGNLTDGVTDINIAYQNGFASNQQHGIIALTFDKPYDITAFKLWNSFIIGEDGVKSFELYFYDSDGHSSLPILIAPELAYI